MDHCNSFLQQKLQAIIAHHGTNRFNTVYLNFISQCQHFDINIADIVIFLSYQWNVLLSGVFLVTGVDISVKT